mmetsp:Transcript_55196/g.142160  ORF Transcript_55196/g.142160 Transcript_55196/m.142160 type:complete len:282 (-) Transcript_55196:197-1042(-)
MRAGALTGVGEEVRIQLLAREAGPLAQECVHGLDCRELLQLRGRKVHLEAVARGEHCNLGHHVARGGLRELHNLLRHLVPIGLRDSQLLAHVNRGLVVAKAHNMDLDHGLHILRVELRERPHSVLLYVRDPLLRVTVKLLHGLPKLTLADGERRLAKAMDGVDERSQKLVNLAEDAPQLTLPERLHGVDDLCQLPTTQQLRLALQGRDLGHECGDGILHIIKVRGIIDGLLGVLRHHGDVASAESRSPAGLQRPGAMAGKAQDKTAQARCEGHLVRPASLL